MKPPTQTARERNKIAELYYRSQRKDRVEYWNPRMELWIPLHKDDIHCFDEEFIWRIAPKKKGKG